jgi:pentatricopeptide repeat protein
MKSDPRTQPSSSLKDKACASLTAEEQGKQFHAYVIKSQFESDVFVGSALIDMYTKCCNIEDASKVFHHMPKRDAVLWSGMIAGYTRHGHAEDALKLYYQMHRVAMKLDHFTFASVLSACAIAEAVEPDNQVHAYVIKTGFQSDVFVGTALVDMYAKFGSMTCKKCIR